MRVASLRLLLLVLLTWLAVSVCPAPAAATPSPDTVLASMTLEEKVGQLFLVWFQGPDVSPDVITLIRQRHIGGVILYATPGNIVSVEQVARLTAGMQAVAAATPQGLGLLIGVDQEGGPVARLRQGCTVFPSQMAQAATGQPELVRQAAAATGRELAALGINVDFAPVADVNINPANPIINIRSFGSDPASVAQLTAKATAGYQDANIICTPKHFPGHGDTAVDSHIGLPRVDHDAQTLARVDFPPFQAAFAAGAPGVMTAHVLSPALAPEGLPATLSPRVLQGILRNRLGFSGVIFTDSLGMGAVAKTYGTAEAAVRALSAGADILLIGADAGRPARERLEAMDRVAEAVRSGRIPHARLDEAVLRILRLKQHYGLLEATRGAKTVPNVAGRTGTPAHMALATRIARQSLTAFGPTDSVLPVKADATTLVIRPRSNHTAVDAAAEKGILAWNGVRSLFLPSDPDAKAIAQAATQAQTGQRVVLLVTDARKYEGQRRLAEVLYRSVADRLLLIAAESPYDLPLLPPVRAKLATYGETPATYTALRQTLFSPFHFVGHCPAAFSDSPSRTTTLSKN